MAYPPNSDDLTEARTTIVNILKMEGYKLNSGELFVAFKESGGEMENFKGALEELTEENKIQSDSDGNIYDDPTMHPQEIREQFLQQQEGRQPRLLVHEVVVVTSFPSSI